MPRHVPYTGGKTLRKINAFTQGVLIELMLDGLYDCHELAERTGLHYVTVQGYCRELHRAGACYIGHWNADSRDRDTIKIYKIGRGTDAKRRKLTPAQRQARTRAGKKLIEYQRTLSFQNPAPEDPICPPDPSSSPVQLASDTTSLASQECSSSESPSVR